MSFNTSKIKNFFWSKFRGNRLTENAHPQNNVRWQAVSEEEKSGAYEEPKPSRLVASFPDELDESKDFVTNVIVLDDNVQVTRASVYLEDNADTVRDSVTDAGSIRKVNSNSNLLDMDTAVINFSETESSNDDDYYQIPESSNWTQPKFELSNSLDIEKELTDLMGTFNFDGRETPSFPNEIETYDNVPGEIDSGSQINLGYEDTESDGESIGSSLAYPSQKDYWGNQRKKSRSFVDRTKLGKLLRNGKQRMSMIEFRSKRMNKSTRSNIESPLKDDAVFIEPRRPCFLRLAYDRSSVVEPRVTSLVSLPTRPNSALADKFPSCASLETETSSAGRSSLSSSSFHKDHRQSLRISGVYDDNIDWAWLEDAVRDLNAPEPQEPEQIRPTTSRVDAGCQTQSEQSWPGEEEGMRNTSSSERVYDSTAITVSSECRALEINGSCDEDMSGKHNVEGSGPSGVSSWLRQSMRRVRHFNLGEPPRIRSAPPDTLRLSVESVRSEGIANPIVANSERGQTQNENVQQNARQQQRPRSAGNRPQRRNLPRPRPVSAPVRRPASSTSHLQVEVGNSQPAPNPPESQDNLGYESDSTDRHPSPRRRRRRLEDDGNEDCGGRSPLGPWPHGLSSVLAGLGCTLGLFNISRFATLSVHFGSNFILQFLILSLILGVPLLAFHAALGQTLGAGPVDMWKISPLFQGIGIALLLAQALIGIYSVVGVSWMFVYFRDSFITKQDTYRWTEPFQFYRDDHLFPTFGPNGSHRLEQTVPEYLYGVVLQRNGYGAHENAFGHLKFQLTFNLAVVWMIVFVSLSKGLRSYGKVVYVFSLVPVLGILVLCSKLLGLTPIHRGLFPQTEWSEFFLNAKSWISAATEVMLTWNLLGAASMQVTSHNRATKRLWRDVITITVITLVVLILAAFLANTCHQILFARGGYGYIPSSFERMQSYTFLRPLHSPLPPSYTIPVRHMPHASLLAGERVGKPGSLQESGYQVVRLATELVPATLALLGGDYLSPFWAVLFYFTLILFGVAQQLAIWHCVITGIMAINAPSLKSWETTITFFTCAAGFVLGLPMTTELGVFVMYFLDYCIGGGWWVLLLTLVQICAVLMVRGRPYSGENISVALFGKKPNCLSIWAVPMLTFSWNVIMPVALLVVCITIFKSGGYRDLWTWRCTGRDYWPLWAREVGVFIQIIPLLCFPIVALIQCYRYLSSGPPDIFDRIANLYRPTTESNSNTRDSSAQQTVVPPNTTAGNGTTDLPPAEDPPPKYTPPPSYSTATGARIAKMLRQSFRRSMRRIQTVLGPEVHIPPRPPPPDYDSVLVEMNHGENSTGESLPQSPENNAFTAADVAQLLRCSFRRVNGTSASHSTTTTTNNQSPQNLVIPPQWNT